MRLSLPAKIFLAHVIVVLVLGGLSIYVIHRAFEDYEDAWRTNLMTAAPVQLFAPMASEVARSLLLRLESEFPEVRELNQKRISEGLSAVLESIPSIESLVIVDQQRRIRYVNDPGSLDLAYRRDFAALFASPEPVVQRVDGEAGTSLLQVMIPVYADAETAVGRRLGSVLIVFRPDAGLVQRMPRELQPPDIAAQAYAKTAILMVAVALLGGLGLATVAWLPVRRLEKIVAEFRARDFRGRVEPRRRGLSPELEQAVDAIEELGGRLEALDVQRRERESLLATLSLSLEEGMLALDSKGEPVSWNPALLRILLGSTPADPGAQAARDQIREVLRRNPRLQEPLREGGAEDFQASLRRRDGKRFSARVSRVPFDVHPGVRGTLCLIRDLETIQKVETHLLESGRFAVLAHLAAGLAHEIRNPLHSINLNATVAEQYLDASGGGRDQAMWEALETVKGETRRLTQLLNNYLGMVRPEREVSVVDLPELVRRVVQLVGYMARKSHVRIETDLDDRLPAVRGIPDRLQQAILNLVLNAIQAMPGGGTVRVRTGMRNGRVRLTVEDTGPGVPSEIARRLFEAPLSSKPGGSGLGLPIVRLIVESHGGRVSFESQPGEGSRFYVDLPPAPSAAASTR